MTSLVSAEKPAQFKSKPASGFLGKLTLTGSRLLQTQGSNSACVEAGAGNRSWSTLAGVFFPCFVKK